MFALSRLIASSDGSSTSSSSSPSSSSPTPSSSRSHASPQYKELTLLFARLSSSTLHEDKRQSITALHELTATHTDLPLSSSQLEQLLSLADDMQRDDPDISRLALQSIHQLLAPPQPGQGGGVDRSSQLELVSMFASTPPYIHLLLSFLTSSHFHLRFTCMQLLTQLLMEKAARDRLQQSIIASGGSVMQLVELLDDSNEVIRGEALLLLEALIHRSPDIQKMVAFNGGFDSLLMAVKREGGLLEAGVIGEDAMRLVCGLLQDNRSNQQLFAEMGCAKLMAMLLQSAEQRLNAGKGQGGSGEGLRDEARSSLCFVLDAVSYVSTSAASLPSLAPLVAPLLDLSLSAQLPTSMRLTCLSLTATLVDGCKQGQQALASHRLSSLGNAAQSPASSSPILFLLGRAMDASGRMQSSLSLHAVRCFFHNNKDAQLQAVMSFSPSASHSPVTVGPLLLQHFSSRASFPHSSSSSSPSSWSPRATALVVASELVRSNVESQQLLLKLPLQQSPSASSSNVTWQDTLLDHMRQLFTSSASSTPPDSVPVEEVAALCFVCDWLNGCAEVAESLFTRQSFLQQLLTLATTHASRYVRGLASYAFLLCLQLQQSSGGNGTYTFLTASSLLSLIQHSISLDLFKQNLTNLHTSSAFTTLRSASQRDINPFHRYTARRMRRVGGEGQEHVFVLLDGDEPDEEEGEVGRVYAVSRQFVVAFDKAYEGMNDRLLSLLTAALSSSTGQGSALAVPASSFAPSAELLRLRDENAALRRDNETLRAQLGQRPPQQQTTHAASETSQLQTIVTQQRQEIAQLKEDLLILQHAEEDRNRASSSSSSSALTTLQRKYDDLQAEHEDLLLLLAQYAQQEEEEEDGSASTQNGDSSHFSIDTPYEAVQTDQSIAAANVTFPAPSYPQNGYHQPAARTTAATTPSLPAAAAPTVTVPYPATTSAMPSSSTMPQPGGPAVHAAGSAVGSSSRSVPSIQHVSHAPTVSTFTPSFTSSSSSSAYARPPPTAAAPPSAAPSIDYYSQLYASRAASSQPSVSSSAASSPTLSGIGYKPATSSSRPSFTPAAPPHLSSSGSEPSRPSNSVR